MTTHILMVIRLAAIPHAHFFWAWILLCLALALHVIDEASTGFLSVYNPSVLALRKKHPWLPIPVFTFGVWLAGLLAATVLLLCLSVFVLHGARWMRPLGFIFAVIMLANGLGHIVGTIFGRTVESIRFPRPMPGFYSSPFVLLASVYLLCEL
jgi:amino acid transporter